MIASKNSLLGLDIHEVPASCGAGEPKPKHHHASPSKREDRDKRRQAVADTVVKALGPYYKDKKVATKVSM